MKWTEDKAITSLVKKRVRVYSKERTIHVKSVGIKLWGAIDYLVHYCGYRIDRGELERRFTSTMIAGRW
jgi:hypothetical protein